MGFLQALGMANRVAAIGGAAAGFASALKKGKKGTMAQPTTPPETAAGSTSGVLGGATTPGAPGRVLGALQPPPAATATGGAPSVPVRRNPGVLRRTGRGFFGY